MSEQLFNESDFKHVTYALKLFPELEFAAFAATKAEDKLKFPVTDLNQLEILFENFESLPKTIRHWRGNMNVVKKYFSTQLLPIVNVQDFLEKVFLSMISGNKSHLENGD